MTTTQFNSVDTGKFERRWRKQAVAACIGITRFTNTPNVLAVSEFVPVIEQLFDEKVLIGSGWTTHDSLR